MSTILLQFLAQNAHFAISLFAALVAFAVFWLIFDAWSQERSFKEFCKWLGFLLISIGFLLYAAIVNQASFGHIPWSNTLELVSRIFRLAGYAAVVFGHLLDPLQPLPNLSGLDPAEGKDKSAKPVSSEAVAPTTPQIPDQASTSRTNVLFAGGLSFSIWQLLLPLSSLGAAFMYYRRSHKGYEKHLRPVTVAFLWLTGFELFDLASLWRNTTNPLLYNWVAAFGYLWIAAHICLLIGMIVLARWVWRYLVKRLRSQLFMIFIALTMMIFLITTVSFTYLLMHNMQNASLTNLQTATQVLDYSLESNQSKVLGDAEIVGQQSGVVTGVMNQDHKAIDTAVGNYMAQKGLSSLIITNQSGEVLLRAEDPSRWGQSVSSDPLVRRALVGSEGQSIVTQSGVIAPTVAIAAVTPIRNASGTVIGAVEAQQAINNSFVDGIKHATGLDSSVYAGLTRAATTFVAPDGTSRWIGVTETNGAVAEQVIHKGQVFKGTLSILNQSYLAVYAPLKDVNNNIVGMLFVGESQISFLQTVARSIELTFIVAIALLVLAVAPIFLIARYLSKQLEE